ncbi:MAG: hypothetical protein GY795_21045 [Desulfobacterales bacterium]|nr:hypothetical protein [Desulfobacterales bacterium]
MKKMIIFWAMIFLSSVFAFRCYAVEIKFSDFSDISMLAINGSARVIASDDGIVLRITSAESWQGGSFFSKSPLNVSEFSSFFKFRITQPGGVIDKSGESGADWLRFVVQAVGTSLGSTGEIGGSIGAEFDIFQNNWDPSSNHIAIDTAGSLSHKADFSDTAYVSTKFDNGKIWYSWVDYDGTVLELRVSQTQTRPSEPTLSMEVDIPEIIGQNIAYAGFISATGDGWANHDILYWEYRDAYPCNGDISGDGKIGLEEAIHALQVVSGLTP